jgi:DNA repair protein RadD
LVLDFGENIKRHGPIDAIDYGKPRAKAGERLPEDDAGKECPNCSMVVPTRKLVCECGFRFGTREPKHEVDADTLTQIISEPEFYQVAKVHYSRHEKEGKTPSLRVDYRLDVDGNLDRTISEWVCLEHAGFARSKAVAWWKARSEVEPPEDVNEALDYCFRGYVACPKSIEATREGKFYRVTKAEIEEIPSAEILEEEVPF